jgi:hypothetical protein
MPDKYIKEILTDQGKVNVPKLGLIYKDLETNGNPFDPNILKKPVYKYKIDQDYSNDDDTWLLYAIARGNHTTLDEAEVMINNKVNHIKSQLNEGQDVTIEGVGTLRSSHGRLEFVDSIIEENDSFGMPGEIVLSKEEEEVKSPEPVYEYSKPEREEEEAPVSYREENSEEPVTEREEVFAAPVTDSNNPYNVEDTYPYEDEKPRSKTGLFVIIAILLLIGFGLTYYFFLRPNSNDTLAVTEPMDDSSGYDSSAVSNSYEETSAETGNTDIKPLSVKEEGKRYYIIAGSFTINENAQKLKRKLDSKGVKATIIEARDAQGIYRVSLADFEELQDAVTKSESLKKKHGNSLWILKY